jgi:hypothetical protein
MDTRREDSAIDHTRLFALNQIRATRIFLFGCKLKQCLIATCLSEYNDISSLMIYFGIDMGKNPSETRKQHYFGFRHPNQIAASRMSSSFSCSSKGSLKTIDDAMFERDATVLQAPVPDRSSPVFRAVWQLLQVPVVWPFLLFKVVVVYVRTLFVERILFVERMLHLRNLFVERSLFVERMLHLRNLFVERIHLRNLFVERMLHLRNLFVERMYRVYKYVLQLVHWCVLRPVWSAVVCVYKWLSTPTARLLGAIFASPMMTRMAHFADLMTTRIAHFTDLVIARMVRFTDKTRVWISRLCQHVCQHPFSVTVALAFSFALEQFRRRFIEPIYLFCARWFERSCALLATRLVGPLFDAVFRPLWNAVCAISYRILTALFWCVEHTFYFVAFLFGLPSKFSVWFRRKFGGGVQRDGYTVNVNGRKKQIGRAFFMDPQQLRDNNISLQVHNDNDWACNCAIKSGGDSKTPEQVWRVEAHSSGVFTFPLQSSISSVDSSQSIHCSFAKCIGRVKCRGRRQLDEPEEEDEKDERGQKSTNKSAFKMTVESYSTTITVDINRQQQKHH